MPAQLPTVQHSRFTRTTLCLSVIAALHWPLVHAQSATPDTDAADDEQTRLETIQVEPGSTSEPVTELPNGTAVSGSTLAKTPGSGGDPLISLQTLPGLAYTSDDEPLPAVRGSRPDDNIFLIDDLPVNYLFHMGGLISVINPDLVKSFNIYPSAYGPEFAGVTGGVFDIKLRDPKKDRLHKKVDISLYQTGVLVEGPVSDNQSFYLAGRISYLDLLVGDQLEDEVEDGVSIIQFPKYKDYQGKYVWDINDDVTLRMHANGSRDDIELNLSEDAEGIETDPILAGSFLEASGYDQQGLSLNMNLGPGKRLDSAISHSSGSTRFQIGGAGKLDASIDRVLAKSQLTVPVGQAHDITLGGQVTQSKLGLDLEVNAALCTEFETDCNFTAAQRLETHINRTINSQRVFLKDSWYVNDQLTLYPGVTVFREDWLDKTHAEPRFALEYALSDDLTLNAGAGVYHQMPSFEQFDKVFGNPELKYIKSTHALIGLEKKFRGGWSAKSELYYKDLQDLVSGDDDKNYANNGEGSTVGIDTLIRKDLTDRFSGWLSLTVSDSTRTNRLTGEKFDFEYDQPINATLVGSYKLSEKWTLAGKLWVHSGALYTPVVGAVKDPEVEGLYNPQYGPINSERFPMYKRLDVRLDRTVKKSEKVTFSTYFEILNLLDSDNVSSLEYNKDYSEKKENKQIPLFLSLGFKVNF